MMWDGSKRVRPILAWMEGHYSAILHFFSYGQFLRPVIEDIVFGAPERLSDHADRAVAAARGVTEALMERFGPEPFRFGIGINSGPVVVGSVGGGGRLEFAVIGDPVNVAARVEHLTRETGDVVLVTEATRCLLARDDFELAPRGEFALKGLTEPVPIYALRLSLDKSSSRLPKASQAQA